MFGGSRNVALVWMVVLSSILGEGETKPHPQALFQGQGQENKQQLIQMCENRLREGIQSFCKNPLAFYLMFQKTNNLHQKRSFPPPPATPLNGEAYDDEESEEEEEYDMSRAMPIETRRRNIVDACCRNACSFDEFKRYCYFSTHAQESRTTTTTPPPTTTVPGPEFGRPSFAHRGTNHHHTGEGTVTDKPRYPNVGFSLGTHDGVQFNH